MKSLYSTKSQFTNGRFVQLHTLPQKKKTDFRYFVHLSPWANTLEEPKINVTQINKTTEHVTEKR